jgi:hypothetical protein
MLYVYSWLTYTVPTVLRVRLELAILESNHGTKEAGEHLRPNQNGVAGTSPPSTAGRSHSQKNQTLREVSSERRPSDEGSHRTKTKAAATGIFLSLSDYSRRVILQDLNLASPTSHQVFVAEQAVRILKPSEPPP